MEAQATQKDDLREELKDLVLKAQDCISSLEAGKALDEVQEAFIKELFYK